MITVVVTVIDSQDWLSTVYQMFFCRVRFDVAISIFHEIHRDWTASSCCGTSVLLRLHEVLRFWELISSICCGFQYTNSKPATEDPDAEMQANLGVFWQSVPHHRIFVHQVGEFHVDSLIARAGHPTEIVVALIKSTKMVIAERTYFCCCISGLR